MLIKYNIFNVSMLYFDLPDNMKVNLKDFLEEVKNAPSFKDSIGAWVLLLQEGDQKFAL